MKNFPAAFLILAVIILGALYVDNDEMQNKRLHELEARPYTIREVPVISEREETCLLHTVSIALVTAPYENNSELFINDYRLCMGVGE